MQIIKVGISYHHAPIAIREKATFSGVEAEHAMTRLNLQEVIMENVIFSTCNRTEVYALAREAETGIQAVQQSLMEWFQMEQHECMHYFTSASNQDAISHLFKLAAGLDSMVIGETQILGQVKDAFTHAMAIKATGKMLNELFKRVITFAKRSHKDTAIGEHAVSISYVAVELAKRTFDNIADKRAVVVGAGETGELSLKNLQGAGVSNVTVINRTFKRARALAETCHAEIAPYGQLTDVLVEADIVITATASPQVILTRQMLEDVMEKRKGKTLCLIDIAVPRDVDTDARDLTGLYLYDVDDLAHIANKNMATRKKVADEIEQEINVEVEAFYEWVTMQDAVPVIRALQEKSLNVQKSTWLSLRRKLPDLTEHEAEVLQKHMKSIAHQLLEEPLRKAKSMGRSEEGLAQLRDVFGLDDSPDELKTSKE